MIRCNAMITEGMHALREFGITRYDLKVGEALERYRTTGLPRPIRDDSDALKDFANSKC